MYSVPIRTSLGFLCGILACLCASCGFAQDHEAPTAEAAPALTVSIKESKKFGDLPYRPFIDSFRLLQSYQPPEPRLVDVLVRARYPSMSDTEQDAYLPKKWGVAIVSRSVDVTVPVRRGGYFVPPTWARPRSRSTACWGRFPTSTTVCGI